MFNPGNLRKIHRCQRSAAVKGILSDYLHVIGKHHFLQGGAIQESALGQSYRCSPTRHSAEVTFRDSRVIGKCTPITAHSYLRKFARQLEFGELRIKSILNGSLCLLGSHAGHIDITGDTGRKIFSAQLDLTILRSEIKFKLITIFPRLFSIKADHRLRIHFQPIAVRLRQLVTTSSLGDGDYTRQTEIEVHITREGFRNGDKGIGNERSKIAG